MKSYYEQQTSNQSKLKITNMNIESHLKQAGYPDEYDGQKYSFEQRGTNDLEREKFYFNQPCLEVSISNDNKAKLSRVIQNMHNAIKGCGIGLAHNQYHKQQDEINPQAIFVIECAPNVHFEAFINPVIVGYSKEKIGFYHGCLSAIGHDMAKMATYKEILVTFYNENFELQTKKYSGLAAVIIQHELNHLTTRGAYVDIVESYIKEHPESKNRKLYFTEEEVLSDTERKLMKEVGDDVPCLIPINILSRCKNYLHQHTDYQKDLENYLRINANDQILVNNLMSIDYKDSEPLYNWRLEFK